MPEPEHIAAWLGLVALISWGLMLAFGGRNE